MAAGNEWINGYLEAILDTGERIHDQGQIGVNDFKAAKYFVQSVTGFDDSSLYRTWIKVCDEFILVFRIAQFFLTIFRSDIACLPFSRFDVFKDMSGFVL